MLEQVRAPEARVPEHEIVTCARPVLLTCSCSSVGTHCAGHTCLPYLLHCGLIPKQVSRCDVHVLHQLGHGLQQGLSARPALPFSEKSDDLSSP